MISLQVFYEGRVQGVGFRFTVRHIAKGFDVTGWVRNLPDGSVELIAEGDTAEVDRFIEALGRQMADYITSASVQHESPQGLTDFRIRHD